MQNRTLLCASILSLVAVLSIGCHQSTEGTEGKVLFTPTYCGPADFQCSFEDAVGVAGEVTVRIKGKAGVDTGPFDLRSSDPGVFTVQKLEGLEEGDRAWTLRGVKVGSAQLQAFHDKETVDYIDVRIESVGLLEMGCLPANGDPQSDESFDQIWDIGPNQDTICVVHTYISEGVRAMGEFGYQVTMDPTLENAQTQDANPTNGILNFSIGEGQYTVIIILDGQTQLRVRLDA